MNKEELINLIGKWIVLITCVFASIYFATQGKMEYASGFGIAAAWGYFIMF